MQDARHDLGSLLKAWRDRLSPRDVGLPAGDGRRAKGLRREELAALAGLSVDYVVRLEQGRATHPSAQVAGSLARALQLSDAERERPHAHPAGRAAVGRSTGRDPRGRVLGLLGSHQLESALERAAG